MPLNGFDGMVVYKDGGQAQGGESPNPYGRRRIVAVRSQVCACGIELHLRDVFDR